MRQSSFLKLRKVGHTSNLFTEYWVNISGIPCKDGAKSYQQKSKNRPIMLILFHPCDLSVVRILVDYRWLLWTARIQKVWWGKKAASKREGYKNLDRHSSIKQKYLKYTVKLKSHGCPIKKKPIKLMCNMYQGYAQYLK